MLREPAVDEVVIGAAETAEPAREVWGRAAAVVLAAGEAKRFGRLKQLLPWQGTPLVAHVVQQALATEAIAGVVVSTGAQAGLVHAALLPHQQQIALISVADWAVGQSRSVRSGLHAAQAGATGKLSGALFLLADQPGVTPDLLAALIQCHRQTLAPVVAPRYQGKRGNPVLFDRQTFDQFDGLEGDTGARSIIQRYEGEVAWVDWPTDEILRDIDTPEDYDAAREQA
jgi:molybdenum cofactor cytidylyltransferase